MLQGNQTATDFRRRKFGAGKVSVKTYKGNAIAYLYRGTAILSDPTPRPVIKRPEMRFRCEILDRL